MLREMDSMTAPVAGSCGLPACTARVPNPWTGEGARGGVEMGWSVCVIVIGGVTDPLFVAVFRSIEFFEDIAGLLRVRLRRRILRILRR